jgi:hypothetical protein
MPDLEPRHHLPDEGPMSYFRNLKMPDSMMDSFPPLDVGRETFAGIGQFADDPE